MKKLLNTLASTKPDYLSNSQPSELDCNSARKPVLQLGLLNVLNQMKKICQIRSVLLFRDIQNIYRSSSDILVDLLSVKSPEQFWKMFANEKSEQLHEKKQIKILVKLLESICTLKNEEGDKGNSYAADQYRKIIQWFIPQIVKYEQNLMNKIQNENLMRLSDLKQHRKIEFDKKQRKVISSFDQNQTIRRQKMFHRFKKEHEQKQMEIHQKIEREIYKVNPSKMLREAKDKSLMKKLGPFRLNKSNPYEDRGYSCDLSKMVQSEQQRKLKVIDHLKRVQKQRLSKYQKKLFESQQMNFEHKRDQIVTTLQNDRQQLENYQKKISENLVHNFQNSKNKKVGILRKTLQAYVKHEDSIKIKEILLDHQQKIHHNNSINDIVAPEGFLKSIPNRYATICGTRGISVQKQFNRHRNMFQRKLENSLNEEQGIMSTSFQHSRRKSLVEMYDKELKLL